MKLHISPQKSINFSALFLSCLIQLQVNKRTKSCICCMLTLNACHALYFTQKKWCETFPLRRLNGISHEKAPEVVGVTSMETSPDVN